MAFGPGGVTSTCIPSFSAAQDDSLAVPPDLHRFATAIVARNSASVLKNCLLCSYVRRSALLAGKVLCRPGLRLGEERGNIGVSPSGDNASSAERQGVLWPCIRV